MLLSIIIVTTKYIILRCIGDERTTIEIYET